MSDAHNTPADAAKDPTPDELDRVAIEATLRRAPRFGRMIGTGAWIAALIGIVLAFVLPNSSGVGRGIIAVLFALGFGTIGALTAAAIATRIDGTRTASVSDDSAPSWMKKPAASAEDQ